MPNFNAKLIEALAKGTNINEIFCQQLEEVINLLVETERTTFLGYEPYNVSGHNSGKSRNGYYSRTSNAKFGELKLNIPRDRIAKFSQRTIQSYEDSVIIYSFRTAKYLNMKIMGLEKAGEDLIL